MLAKMWANYIIEGSKIYSQVPLKLKPEVKEILIDKGYEHLVVENG